MSILEQYRQEVETDKQNQNNDYADQAVATDGLTEEQKEQHKKLYEAELEKLRKSSEDIENAYKQRKASMIHISDSDLMERGLLKVVPISKVEVKRAYCEQCGEELISNAPPMFNPYTFERVCKHTCTKCGAIYNLDYAYPRIAYIDDKGEEIKAYGM